MQGGRLGLTEKSLEERDDAQEREPLDHVGDSPTEERRLREWSRTEPACKRIRVVRSVFQSSIALPALDSFAEEVDCFSHGFSHDDRVGYEEVYRRAQ